VGACTTNEGPCNYTATPCPSVVNGTVNGYLCTCLAARWTCEVVNQSGLCSPIPEDGGEDGGGGIVVPLDGGSTGPTGSTGPNQP
jgi:hypothetical protein